MCTHTSQNQEVSRELGFCYFRLSLRYMSRVVYQAGMRVVQGIKEQASKYDSTIKTLKDSACGSSASSSKQARKFSTLDSSAINRAAAEESLRTVMFLSCWGPN